MTKKPKIDFASGFRAPDGVYEVVGRGDATGVRVVEGAPLYLQQFGRARRPEPLDIQHEAPPAGRIAAAIERLKDRS